MKEELHLVKKKLTKGERNTTIFVVEAAILHLLLYCISRWIQHANRMWRRHSQCHLHHVMTIEVIVREWTSFCTLMS